MLFVFGRNLDLIKFELLMGMKGNKNMKNSVFANIKTTGAALMSTALLISMTACGSASQESSQFASDETTTVASTTNSVIHVDTQNDDDHRSEVPEPVVEPSVASMDSSAVYSSYLTVLESLKGPIKQYNWMDLGWDDSNWLFPATNIPCALADVTGDGIEELIVMEDKGDVSAMLEVYAFDDSTDTAVNILTVDYLNPQLNDCRGVAVAVSGEGKLIIIDTPREENEYETYTVYSYDGSELIPEYSVTDIVCPDNEGTEFYHKYRINDEGVTEAEYNTAKSSVIDSIDTVLQYAMVFDEMTRNKITGMYSIAMSYDDMHDHLSGLD